MLLNDLGVFSIQRGASLSVAIESLRIYEYCPYLFFISAAASSQVSLV
jgi:hypothetical protein